MSWLSDILPRVKKRKRRGPERGPREGVWEKCEKCGAAAFAADFRKTGWVCADCDHHHRITAAQRAEWFFDPEPAAEPLAANIRPLNFLRFADGQSYEARLEKARDGEDWRESAGAWRGRLLGMETVAVMFDFNFMGGSMGCVAGERFARAAEEAARLGLPFLSFSASGGARMQEGLASLLQMAKTTAALDALSRRGLPYISVLSDPCTGGVAASFALIADVVVAEPNALVGFAGPRVIRETVREELPEGFQRSEFLLQHGNVDLIADRREMRETLARIIALLTKSPAREGAEGD